MRKRPFYTHPQPADPQYSNSFDLLFRGLELVTGGQRLHRPPTTSRRCGHVVRPGRAYAAYLQSFRHGMPPHGGFAIGLERFVARLVGPPTSARSRCSRATSTGSRRDTR